MKDTTKHIIAKELFFFFKWLLIGLGIAIVISIIFAFLYNRFGQADLFDLHMFLLALFAGLPFWLYVARGIRWLVAWIKKWK